VPAADRPRLERSRAARLLLRIVKFVGTTAFVIAGLWATLALMLADLDGQSPRIVPAILFGLAFFGVSILLKPRWRARAVAAVLVAAVGAWYFRISPSNDRAWAPQYATLATATIDGDRVTLHNYRALEPTGPDGALAERYVDRTFDVRDLVRADLVMSFWGPKRIAHAQVSFEFTDGRFAAASIEVRRRVTQKGFDAVRSLFRNFELIYVVGDERALIGPSTLDDYHRLYVYRTRMSRERARALFLRYAERLNELARQPEWYNGVTDNCTTGIYMHLREIPPAPPLSLSILVNGYLPQYAQRQGTLDTSLPFEELQRRSDVKQAGRAAYASEDFSRRIRENIPTPPQVGEPQAGQP
jgi:hypothetical protein